jgi:multidrug efflux pump subunit AcrB
MSYLRKTLNGIPGIIAYVEDITAMGGGGMGRNAPLQFRIKGPELSQLSDLSAKIIARLRSIDGIVGVGSDMQLTKPEVRVYIDRDKAADLGVSSPSQKCGFILTGIRLQTWVWTCGFSPPQSTRLSGGER